jgi:predicted phosphoribosyltransferase
MGFLAMVSKYFHFLPTRIVFKNRQSAGKILGNNLRKRIMTRHENSSFGKNNSLLVIGIPRGGLVVANEIALKLGCELGAICPVRIVDEDEETTLGSILITDKIPTALDILSDRLEDGLVYLNNDIRKDYLIENKERILKRIILKHMKFGSNNLDSITNKVVILADDGVFSGASAIVALRWIRRHQPKELIFACPIAPSDVVTMIKDDTRILVDHLEILKITSSTDYKTVDYYYKDFEDCEDQYVGNIIEKSKSNLTF